MSYWNHLVICCLLTVGSACSGTRSHDHQRTPAITAPAGSHAIRVMTFNIQSCSRGTHGVAALIEAAQPDLVALQEVDDGTRRSGGEDQTRILAERMGYTYSAHLPVTQMHGGAYGMALLSRHPIERIDRWPLPVDPGMEPRIVARAIIRLGDDRISVWKTHLSPMPMRTFLRAEQVAHVIRLMRGDSLPQILLGDMNDVASSKPIQLLSAAMRDAYLEAGSGPAGTYPLPLPTRPTFRYDYVMTSAEWRIHRAFVIQSNASDHYPVVADLELPGRGAIAPIQEATHRPKEATPPSNSTRRFGLHRP